MTTMPHPGRLLRMSIVLLGLLPATAGAQDGETLFKQNCGACHVIGRRLVGPDLTGVTEKRSKEWLHKFIRSSQTMIKSGDPDAVAVFKENNELIMTDINLDEAQIDQVLAYLGTFGKPAEAATAAADTVPEAPITYTDADRAAGRELFDGTRALSARGPACISCHNVNSASLMVGGTLAKDLTEVHARMGHAGITGILGAPPFPAMASSYANAPITAEEAHQLAAFLEEANTRRTEVPARSAAVTYGMFGGGGLALILLLIGLHWRRRLKGSVKQDILDRQLRSI